MQVVRYSTGVYSQQASFEERAKLVSGQVVTRPFIGRFFEQTYTRGSDLTIPNVTETGENLTVNTAKATPFSVDDLDALQSNYNSMDEYSKGSMAALNKAIDADYLAEVANATSSVDAGDVGGTSGQGITLDSTNILQIFAAARRKLMLQNVDIVGMSDKRAAIGNMKPMGAAAFADMNPYVSEQLFYSMAGRETPGGDQSGKNGYLSSHFGFDIYETTNGYWTGTLALATQPTDGDTVTINGVVFTFKTTLGSTAGNVLIGASAATANTNLAALINTPGTTTAQGVALSTDNQNLLKRVTATAASTSTAIVAKGYGYLVVSETLTAAADVWTTTAQISHNLFGQKGSIDMVLAKEPSVKVDSIPLQLGVYVKPHTLYGVKTFTEGAKGLVNVKVKSSSWV
jgi:hypothetical protein